MEGKDHSTEEFYKFLKEDAEAYLEPTAFYPFGQLPPLWSSIPKRGRNVVFQTLGMIGDIQRVLKISTNERIELIKALDETSRETFRRNAERRLKLSGMDNKIKAIMTLGIKDKFDWMGS
ncbi:hypothetical protein P9112_003597 [Eukaryota sp. TZLM1-RC]